MIKSIALCLLIASSTLSYSQTTVIALKSHSGELTNLNSEPDNFGWIEPAPMIDSIVLFDETCIIEIGTRWGNNRYRDTICEHHALKPHGYSLKSCKDYYGSHIKYVGFKKKDQNDGSQIFWSNGNPFKNGGMGFFGLILISYLLYLFTPVFKKR